METKFTKGKWEKMYYNQVVCNDYNIANCENFDLDITGKEAEANALLISKAPEMFEMLLKAERTLREVYDCDTTEIKQLLKEATEL